MKASSGALGAKAVLLFEIAKNRGVQTRIDRLKQRVKTRVLKIHFVQQQL